MAKAALGRRRHVATWTVLVGLHGCATSSGDSAQPRRAGASGGLSAPWCALSAAGLAGRRSIPARPATSPAPSASSRPTASMLACWRGSRRRSAPRCAPSLEASNLQPVGAKVTHRVAEQQRRHSDLAPDELDRAATPGLAVLTASLIQQATDSSPPSCRPEPTAPPARRLATEHPRLGPVVATSARRVRPELGSCSRQQVAALVGVAPFNRDSGAWRGRRSSGAGAPRTALYMATSSDSTRVNPQPPRLLPAPPRGRQAAQSLTRLYAQAPRPLQRLVPKADHVGPLDGLTLDTPTQGPPHRRKNPAHFVQQAAQHPGVRLREPSQVFTERQQRLCFRQ